ncbi:hypothetical protein NQ315_001982 [Exocentrus adspersus]|uniref:Uncharacterized protein n=1 Tax=Exocentrus adspersus TaxID=1586481 RepID=A0AAV8WA23_9CUCU|nr:hypothetical protein NQ315_001982 [Exocentrus adspersus]
MLHVTLKKYQREGSEDEIEVSTQILDLEDHSMERAMIPPQTESALQHYTAHAYPNNSYHHSDEMLSDTNPKISIKLPEELFEKASRGDEEEFSKYSNDGRQQNGKVDIFYLQAREVILASGTLPGELELRENGVFAKGAISKGTRYGPFQGKWASAPKDARFAWEIFISKDLVTSV